MGVGGMALNPVAVNQAVSDPRRPIFIMFPSVSGQVGSPTRQWVIRSPVSASSRGGHSAIGRIAFLVRR